MGSQLDTHIEVVGYCFNRLDEPVFMAVSKPLLTEFGIHRGMESCEPSKAKTFCAFEGSKEYDMSKQKF